VRERERERERKERIKGRRKKSTERNIVYACVCVNK
jgi:hypothetical protein